MKYLKSKPKLINATLSWYKYKHEFNYYFYDDNMCNTFMRDNFNGRVYKAYSILPIGVMKADLWRYCIIYKYGGIYADIDTVCKINPNIFLTDSLLTIVPENNTHLCQWVFAAPKESPILKNVIDLSVERILVANFKGEHFIHQLTGPSVFTDAIENYLKTNHLPVFANKTHYYKYPSDILSVFNFDNFHTNIVCHLFAGQDGDGWCNERDKYLNNK
jgi:mannosyltransferase OCH1-like enzyme